MKVLSTGRKLAWCEVGCAVRKFMAFLRILGMWLVSAVLLGAASPPNVVIIFADDLGYGDLGCYGAKEWQTPNIDRLAEQGTRFTQFYVAQAVCSASRAALLTGKYSHRLPILYALGPNAPTGIPEAETTLAEMFKAKGYATGIFGKWHLGDRPQFHPLKHGFDEFFGIPYSNDMWPHHPTGTYPDLPLIDGNKVIEYNSDQRHFTTLFTESAVKFIEKNKERPFFLYVPHPMPHVPLFVSDKFKGKSKGGLYGDVMMEVDWSVGEIVGALKRQELEKKTIVIFTSDNGPWLSYGNHAGGKGSLREGKGTVFEGGVRVPFIISWPGQVPSKAVRSEPAMSIDILPTLANLVGAEIPKGIDGKDIWPLIKSGEAKIPNRELLFYWGKELQAVRVGNWKLHLAHDYPTPEPAGADGRPGKIITRKEPLALYDLAKDPEEQINLVAKFPKMARELEDVARRAQGMN